MHTPSPLLEVRADPVADEVLLARLVAGDRRALAVLFDRYSRAVYATAILIVRTASDAEEIASDSFLTLWRKRESVRPLAGSLLPWLITTARYEALNRRRSARGDLPLNDEVDSGTSLAPDATLAERDLAIQLDSLIASLPVIDQQIVALCLVEGTSYEDAAQRLGLTHATVRNRLHRARIQLRTDLKGIEDDNDN
jgi:RNA polymerase sigma factor (sigma-70 family)